MFKAKLLLYLAVLMVAAAFVVFTKQAFSNACPTGHSWDSAHHICSID